MSFYQYRPAGTGANDYTLAWDFDWTSPSHITTLNNDPAYNTPPAALGDTSAILLASGFGFTVPAGATIDAVTVEAYARQTGPANAAYQSLLKLYSGDVFIGDSKATAAYLPAAYTWLSWSGNLVYWNTPLTAAEVTAAGFGVGLQVYCELAGAVIDVDVVKMKVFYTLGGGGGGARIPSGIVYGGTPHY